MEGKMNKSEVIRMKCLDCNGSAKEVTLCPVIDCPLWPYRFGYSFRDKRYAKRIMLAKQNYPDGFKYLIYRVQQFIINPQDFPENTKIRIFFLKNITSLMPNITLEEKFQKSINTYLQTKNIYI